MDESSTPATTVINLSYTTSSASDDYYQTVVVNALLAMLRDQAVSGHHHTVIAAIMSIFKTQGLKCVTFLPQVCYFFCHSSNLPTRVAYTTLHRSYPRLQL